MARPIAKPGQRYNDAGLQTYPIANLPKVLDFFGGKPAITSALVSRRPELLEKIFGPKHQTWIGGSENNRFSVWKAEAEGIAIWILCSKKGTDYEFEYKQNIWTHPVPESDVNKIIRFLARTYLQMEDIEPVQKFGTFDTEKTNPILHAARMELDRRKIAATTTIAP